MCPGRPPPSPRFLRTYTVPRTHQLSPHPPVRLCMWGEGTIPPIHRPMGGWGEAVQQPASCSALFIRTLSMGPTTNTCMVGGSMKVEYVRGAPSHSHTQLHTQVLGRLCGGGQGLPSTIIFLLGLLIPAAVVWAAKYSHGAKGERIQNQRFTKFYIPNSMVYSK